MGVGGLVNTHVFVATFPLFRVNSTLVADSIRDNTVVGLLVGNALLHIAPFFTAATLCLHWGPVVRGHLPSRGSRLFLAGLYHGMFAGVLLATVLATNVKHTYAVPGMSDATIEAALGSMGAGIALALLPVAGLLVY